MFASRRRPVVYTQYEHMRLAGALALGWGNERFARPSLPFDAFVAGVALHDFGYGLVDDHRIGAMGSGERRATLERLVEARLEDPIAETVALFHARRLIGDGDPALADRCARRIDALLERTGRSRAEHEAADRITDLCDSVAFHFCFEVPREGRVAVPCPDAGASGADASGATREVAWRLDGRGRVTLDPWPLRPPRLDLAVVAFGADGYPERLVPLVARCEVRPLGRP